MNRFPENNIITLIGEAHRHELSPRTKLVSLASPRNPSGVSIPARSLRSIIAMMIECCPGAYLLIDETYREAAYGMDAVAGSAIGLGSKVISVSSLSKCHGAPGLRLGWAITKDAALRRQLVLGKFNTVLSCSPIDEALGLQVLAQQDRIIGERRQRLADGLARTADWVLANEDLIEWVRPNAGALCCIRLRPSIFDDVAVSRFHGALSDMGIGIGDGRWFGDDARVLRLGFGYHPMPVLQAALDALAVAIRRAARAAA